MKKKEKASIVGMTIEELKAALRQIDNQLRELVIDRDSSQKRNTREGKNLRRKRAVILTVLTEKEFVHE